MKEPSSKGLTHAYPMFKGCSIEEIGMLLAVCVAAVFSIHVLISLFLCFTTSVAWFYFRFGLIGVVLLSALSLRFIAIPYFARAKKGKPNNFWRLGLAKKFNTGLQSRRTGYWDTRLSIQSKRKSKH
jgi:conjugative transfer region protein (TIGR03750 family)